MAGEHLGIRQSLGKRGEVRFGLLHVSRAHEHYLAIVARRAAYPFLAPADILFSCQCQMGKRASHEAHCGRPGGPEDFIIITTPVNVGVLPIELCEL